MRSGRCQLDTFWCVVLVIGFGVKTFVRFRNTCSNVVFFELNLRIKFDSPELWIMASIWVKFYISGSWRFDSENPEFSWIQKFNESEFCMTCGAHSLKMIRPLENDIPHVQTSSHSAFPSCLNFLDKFRHYLVSPVLLSYLSFNDWKMDVNRKLPPPRRSCFLHSLAPPQLLPKTSKTAWLGQSRETGQLVCCSQINALIYAVSLFFPTAHAFLIQLCPSLQTFSILSVLNLWREQWEPAHPVWDCFWTQSPMLKSMVILILNPETTFTYFSDRADINQRGRGHIGGYSEPGARSTSSTSHAVRHAASPRGSARTEPRASGP